MSELTREETEALIQEVLEVYPEKARKDRAKHLAVNDQSVEQSKKCITSNRKSLPGVMTIRGCAYAGSKGVVWGPIKDMIHISTARSAAASTPRRPPQLLRRHHRRRHLRHHELHLGLPGEGHRLRRRQEAGQADRRDRAAVPAAQGHLGPVRVPDRPDRRRHRGGVQEGRQGNEQADRAGALRRLPRRFQSLGHHIANDAIRDWVLDKTATASPSKSTPYDVAIIGDYNIGGDAWSSASCSKRWACA
jgi:nitrogenase molybdenum-iron protein alpha chain